MIYSTGTNSSTQRRFGDESGFAVRTREHVDDREMFSLSADGTGPTVRVFAHFQHQFEYSIPGDLSSRTETFTGVDVHNTAPGVGLIVHEVGLKTFDIDGNVLVAHGPHPLLEDFEGSLAKLCDALS